MPINISLPTLGLILTSALIDSINPCAIGVLILMATVILGSKKSVKKLLLMGGLYVSAIFTTYLLAGLGILYFFSAIPLLLTEYLSILVGCLMILFAVFEIKDYFWYGQGFSLGIPVVFTQTIHRLAQNLSFWGVILTGFFVAGVELPCTGAPYLAVITILSINFNFTAFLWLFLYNIIFVLPLVLILLLIAAGLEIQKVQNWKTEARGNMRLMIGLLLIALAWILMLIANGTVNFG